MVTHQTFNNQWPCTEDNGNLWICVSSLWSVVTLLPWQWGVWLLVRQPLGKFWRGIRYEKIAQLTTRKPLNISPLRNGTLHSFSVLLSDYSFWTNSADVLCCDCLDSLRLEVVWKYPRSKFLAFFTKHWDISSVNSMPG